MRTLIIAMGLAAISATPAFAQNPSVRPAGSAPAAGPVTPPNSSSTSNTSATGTTTTSTSGTSTSTTATGTPSISAEANLTAGANTATTGTNTSGTNTTTTTAGAGNAFGTNVQTDPNATSVTNSTPSFGPGGSFSNDSGNSALGQSPGQSSSGTAAGNSSSGFADSSTLGIGGVAGTTTTLVPEGTVSVIGGGTTGAGMATPAAPQQQQVTIAGQTQTPLFDQAAREGRAKEARRRARGDEPRIYGIAPNTDRDLTWQMPDDRIIRY